MSFRSFFFIGLLSVFAAVETSAYAQASAKEGEQLDFAQGLLSRGMYDMAIQQYLKFISDYPKSPALPEAYLSLGEGYFLSQQFSKAIDAFHQFNGLFPHSDQLPLSELRLGEIAIQEKKYDDALKELTSVDVAKIPKAALRQSFDFYMAKAYLGKGDANTALAIFQKAALIEGATDYTAYAWQEMGKIDVSSGSYAQALDVYEKSMQAAKDDPLKAELTYREAEVQFLSGNYLDAAKAFGLVLEQYPNGAYAQDALANMLLAYFNLGQYDQLLKAYQEQAGRIKDDELSFPIHFAAVRAYIELKQYDKANILMDRMLGTPSLKTSQRAKLFVRKAAVLITQLKYKDALNLVQAYAPENPDNADENLFLQAQAYYGLSDFDRAFNFFENVYLNFPNSRYRDAALLGLAHCRKATGRYRESEALFLKYYSMPGAADLKSESLYDAVMMAAKAGDIKGLIKAAQEYLKAYPNADQYTEVLLVLADVYGKSDQPKEAVKLLQEYLTQAAPQRPNSANFLLGFYLQMLGQTDQALLAYKQVDPNKEKGAYYMAAVKNMGVIYLAQKDFDQASRYLGQLMSQPGASNDLQLKTYIWVCNEYLKRGNYPEVLRVTDEAQKHFPGQDLREIKYFEAEALRGLSRCEDAAKDYDLVLSSGIKDAYSGSARIGYGLCLESTDKYDGAKDQFNKALDENAEDYTVTVHANFELAGLYLSLGDLDEALKLYLLVATIYDDQYYCSESLLRAGGIFERRKQKAEALKAYQEILDKYKNSAAAKTAQQRVLQLK